MIDAKVLLADLTRLLKRLEDDLRERALSPASEVPELRAQLQAEWQAARDAERTAETFETWVDQVITQAGVHWLLSCVFLRFIEDNKLVDRPWLGGTPSRAGWRWRATGTRPTSAPPAAEATATTCWRVSARPARCRACTPSSTRPQPGLSPRHQR
ncbi:MAG: hypothetical protein V5B44_04485 [Candidatus Accumulibacter necessarius]|jgi:hypothetical protein|uniref:hypothetical protein n=1 Tax=Candidatus Accumulibacter necessarius TaxID=2954386 RepID=UPI002FC2F163